MTQNAHKAFQNSTNEQGTNFLDRNECFALMAKLASSPAINTKLAFIWIGLDRFKQINESFGHNGGDTVIAQIALRLRSKTPDRTEWSRMSGDEFVCIMMNSDLEQAHHLALDLLREIETPLPLGGILLRPSASIGIAIQESNEDPFSCLERADRAMDAAKHDGGGRVAISGDELVPGKLGIVLARKELEIEDKLHLALENGSLELHYQPIIGFDGRIEAVEALMRCKVDGENISPAIFIPVAEKTGLISRLGDWSLLVGTQFAQRMEAVGLRTKVAINVSRAQLTSPNFSSALHAAILCAKVNPELIELELTESLFMDLSETVQKNLRAARDAGLCLAIDDFGTGYSCLANLKDIPATKIKLDRAFVIVLPHDRRAFAVVKALTQLGSELGMTVVAEGVEKQEQLDSLREAGVHAIQGYFYARPMPEESMFQWLQLRMSR